MKHETSSLSQSSLVARLLVPLILLNLESLNIYMRAWGVKPLSVQERSKPETASWDWMCSSPWDPIACIPGSWRNWLMWLPSCSPSDPRSCGCQTQSSVIGKRETSLSFIRKGERRTWGAASWWASPLCLGQILLDDVLRHMQDTETEPVWLHQG